MKMHFEVLVLIPADSSDIYQEVKKRLASYDGELEVEEYETECVCLSQEMLLHELAAQHGDSLTGEFHYDQENPEKAARRIELINQNSPLTAAEEVELDALQREFSNAYDLAQEPFRQAQWDVLSSDPPGKPDPACEFCQGTGWMKGEGNPNTKYFSWEIGGCFSGRWAHCRKQTADSPKTPPRKLSLRQKLNHWLMGTVRLVDQPTDHSQGNIIPVRRLLQESQTPHDIVTPEGDWHSVGDTDLYPVAVRREKEAAWARLCQKLYEENSSCIAVVCDIRL